MPLVKKEQRRSRKQETQFSKNPKKKRLIFVKLRGFGCKGTPVTESTPGIIRSAADWEAKGARSKNQKKRKPLHSRRNPESVPVVCCTPPGIGIASDVAPRATNPVPRLDHRKVVKPPREGRRNDDDVAGESPAVISVGIGSRANHRTAEEIIEMLMSRQALLPGRILRRHDQYQDWRLDVDDMSYEELLKLGDKIGYVGTGLEEAEITNCLRRLKHPNHKELKCSICQEKCRKDEEVGVLECGHHHHVECIKQWLLQKNACPVFFSTTFFHFCGSSTLQVESLKSVYLPVFA